MLLVESIGASDSISSDILLQGHYLVFLVHEDGAHDFKLLVLDPVLLIDSLQVFGKDSDAFFQDLIIERHLLLPRGFLLLVAGGCTCRRRRSPVRPTYLQLITLSGCRWAYAALSSLVRIGAGAVATAIVLRAKLDHVLVHQLLGLVDVGRLGIDPRNQALRDVLDEF